MRDTPLLVLFIIVFSLIACFVSYGLGFNNGFEKGLLQDYKVNSQITWAGVPKYLDEHSVISVQCFRLMEKDVAVTRLFISNQEVAKRVE